jgi:citrate synthase
MPTGQIPLCRQAVHGRSRRRPTIDQNQLLIKINVDVNAVSTVIVTLMTQLIDVPAGLKGVVVAETSIGDVRGEEGFYHYRQYSATALARERTFEEVWYLVQHGELPGPAERAAFAEETARHRALSPRVANALPAVAALASADRPLQALRAAYELVVLDQGMAPWLDLSRAALADQAIVTGAVFPTLAAGLYRLARGEQPIAPREDLGHAANYLYMLDAAVPSAARARALETYLISTIDHGFNASTFTSRVVASAGADLGSAVIGALGTLSGPLHGGAPSRVLDMLDEIGTPDRADAWIRSVLARGEVVMGFGHAVYRTDDPRNVMLRKVAEELGSPRLELAEAVEASALKALRELKPGVPLHANVEFYAALVLESVGLPRELFTPTFAVSRVVGWTAHIAEQAGNNKIIRPSARYTGPVPAV